MIQANEIRINNWLHHNESWCYRGRKNPFLKGFDFQFDEADWMALGESTMDISNIFGIPLTEDWLLRFGYKNKREDEFSIDYFVTLPNKARHLVTYYKKVNEFYARVVLKYIHKLQNNVFCLTDGQELEIKK